jgi:hypothetical protein
MTSTRTLARIAGVLYLTVAVSIATDGDYAGVLAPALVGEVAFVVWLLVRSVRVPERDARVPAAA